MWKCDGCQQEFEDVRVQNERLNKGPTTFEELGIELPERSSPRCLNDDCRGALQRMTDPPSIPQVSV
jgi:hypothetical protein